MTDKLSSSVSPFSSPVLRVVFMGTPDFAVPPLRALLEASGVELACVYTQPPRPKGRGHKVQPSPVHRLAEEAGIPVRTPKTLKDPQAQTAFAALNADLAIVAAYGLILPEAVLHAPRLGCVNVHASLLPRWRGASPIQHAVRAGDPETGVTLMQMARGLDTGAMLLRRSVPIAPRMTASDLHDALAVLGGEMVSGFIADVQHGVLPEAVPQDDEAATYAKLLTREDGHVDWAQSAVEIDRQVRAFHPWPGVRTFLNTGAAPQILRIIRAVPASLSRDADPGTLLDRAGHVVCGGGSVLRLEAVQPPGGKPMDVSSACNGGYLAPGMRFVSSALK